MGNHNIIRGTFDHASPRALADDRVIAVFQNMQAALGDHGDLPGIATEAHDAAADVPQTPASADHTGHAGLWRRVGRRGCVRLLSRQAPGVAK